MKYVGSYKDRHGKMRWRFRRGSVFVSLHGSPGDASFEEEYQAALAGTPLRRQQRRRGRATGAKGRKGILYVVQGDIGAPVKIGFTAHHYLELRLAALQTGNASRLRMIAQAEGFFWQEKAAHAALAGERVAGEWFAWAPRTAAFVAALPDGISAALAAVTHLEVAMATRLAESSVSHPTNPLI